MSDYRAALKKLKEQEENEQKSSIKSTVKNTASNTSSQSSFMDSYYAEKERLTALQEEEEEIAPITTVGALSSKSKEEEKERKWFNSGLFEDGYDFGDITKTILGTAGDTVENLSTGVVGMGEKIVDALAYVAPLFAQAQFNQSGGVYNIETQKIHNSMIAQSKKELGDFIAKDLYDEEKVVKNASKAILGVDVDDYSVLGEKSDALVQSGGQLLATAGLQAVGVPWFATTGVTSFGGEAENALNQGASYEEAGLSAAITAGAEILTEKISGGIKFGGKALDDALTKEIARGISNKTVRTLAKMGLDMAGEGAEEVLSGAMSAIGQKITYADDKELSELFSSEEALESFIGGAVLGGVSSGFSAIKSNAKGVDPVSELTKNEQAVVDKVYKDAVAEAEKNGKVSQKKKSELYDAVLRDLEKGYISTDTIEEVLGDKSSYDSLAREADVFDKLYNTPSGQLSKAQQNQLAELEAKNKENPYKDALKLSKDQYSQSVFELVKGDRLSESYNEKGRRSQVFEADLTQYDAKQRAVIQKAVESGILNNTNRTHEFVDIIAKISADKGVLFDFTNNAKLKDSGFAVDGKAVNGYVTKDGITINIDSSKAWQSTVGHEITHVLEGTDMYDALKQTLFDYAKSKGEYDSRHADLTNLYKDIKDADIEAELTADLVGDYLFQDSNFINRLSTENRNVFQKIYDEIKYLYKVATAGSKEARELEKVKKAFEDAYRANGKAKGGTKYSVSDSNIKDINTGYAYDEYYFTMSYTQDGKEVATLEYGVYDDKPNVKMIEVEPEYRRKGIATKLLQELQNKYPDTEIDFGMRTDDGAKLLDSITYDVTDEAVVADRQKLKDLQAELNELQEKLDILYDTENLTEEQDAELHRLGDRWQEVYESIHELAKELKGKKATRTFVKTDAKYSLSDSDGKQLTTEQQEYFKDSKMRDENGNLKVMYHGSKHAGFHVFDSQMSDDNISFFFTDSNDVASSYSRSKEVYEARGFNTAKEMNKFLAEIGYDDYMVVKSGGNYSLYYDVDERVATSDNLKDLYDEFCDYAGVGEGEANYKVYLNLQNPLVVDAEGRNWDNVSLEFYPELYEQWKNDYFTEEEKAALSDLAGWEDYSTFKTEVERAVRDAGKPTADEYTKAISSAFWKHSDVSSLFSIASDNFSDEVLKAEALKQMDTRDYAQKAKAEGYDGVIFKNLVDIGEYGRGRTPSTVAIAFDSNQIKSTANAKPTGDPDIRYSLSDSNGKKLSAEQSKYFKDSKAVDVNGNLQIVYHGTRNADFTVFKRNVNFFTDSKEMADSYSPNGAMYEGYVNITKPYEIDAAGEKWSKIPIDDATKKFLQEYGASVFKEGGKWRTTPADLASAIEEAVDNGDMDYDGIIIRNVDDTGSYYKGNDKNIATDYIVFNSNQFKNADNTKPTADKDIRFSLSETVEETKDLIAVHNLHTAELLETLNLSGLPSPSVAIIKAKDGHEKYGDVSLILPKDAIDPQTNNANRIYGSDAWTPTRSNAQVEYEVDYDIQRQFERTIEALSKNIANGVFSKSSVLGMAGIEDSTGLNLNEIAKKMSDYDAVQAAYVAENGGDVEVVYRTKEFDTYGNDALKGYVDKVGEQEVARLTAKMMTGERLTAEEIETAKDALVDNWVVKKSYALKQKPELREIRIAKFRERLTDMRVEDFVRHAWEFYEDSGATTDEIDRGATSNNLRAAANRSDVEAWVAEKLQGLLSEPGIYNGKEIFAPSGNRRSFKETHWDYTAENIVRAMNNADARGANVWNVSGEAIIATATSEYKNIDEVRADKDRLFKAEDDYYEQIKDDISAELQTVTKDIIRTTEHISDNQYDEEQIIGRVIMEAAQGKKTVASVKRVFQKNGYRIGDAQAKSVLSLFDHASNVPTGYFEAKPKRVVGFDEVGVYVIPRNADVKLKQELLNRGYSIAEYDPDVEGDRQKVVNQFEEYKFSLSDVCEQPRRYGSFYTPATELRYEAPVSEEVAQNTTQNSTQNSTVAENATVSETESVAPVVISKNETTTPVTPEEMQELFPDDLAPTQAELEQLEAERAEIYSLLETAVEQGSANEVGQLAAEYDSLTEKIRALEADESQRANSLDDADVPPEREAVRGYNAVTAEDPFADRSETAVGNRSVKAYQYENPEVKPFFREAAYALAEDIDLSIPAERWYNDDLYYASGGEKGFGGNSRLTAKDVGDFKDEWKCSWDDLREAVNDIIEDNGKENNALSKRVEFLINDRLMYGYTNIRGERIEPNQAYLDFLKEKQINEYSKEAREAFFANADQYAPFDIAPVAAAPAVQNIAPVNVDAPVAEAVKPAPAKKAYEAIRPKPEKQPKLAKATPQEQASASVLVDEPKVEKKKSGAWSMFKDNIVDKGTIFETLSLQTGNRELQGRWKSIGRAESSAQWFMEHGKASTSSLKSIRETVEKSGKTKPFYEYLYHLHNVDRMNLEERYEDVENKPVFGYDVTSEMSKEAAAKLEKANPEFKEWSKEVYDYMTYLREMMVDSGVISSETAKLWAEMYPHYVPVRRKGDEGLNINVALDTRRTGVNAPIKRATGGNRDILPLFDTMAMRTEQTFKAVARNRFGVTLKNMLGTTIENEMVDIDEAIDSVENEELLQEGKNGRSPTFTVFENGEKVTFEITDEMYDTMKPKSKAMGYTNKVLNTANNIRRGLLTEYNPAFMLTNPIKDTQDVLMNSQHPAKTYANYPKAIAELIGKNGQYYQEYMEHGGEQNTYFDGEAKTFVKEKSGLSKAIGFPLEKISQANNFIERIPRMAEYIASRKEGRSIDVSMLDAARVTTDFSAGGDLVKWANRNGFTFLNASVQGAVQQVRNVREAKAEGLKGWAKLAAKVAAAGLPSILLNHLLWDDDEEYEELSDYVKQNYYIVGKYGDGKFVRIPKGRTLAVIQNAFEQMENLVTGNDEVDLEAFGELVISNLAPSNPLENNLIAPITQALNNTTWYGDDLVPTRLQDLPAEEQFDETTDSVSKWLGEKLNLSPYKINYVLDQYSGAVGDVFLPMLTQEAERGDNTLIAPISDKFTTDSVMKNQNISDFYDKKSELTTNAKASGATEEDVLMNKYMNSINSELSELYAEKRRIQNSYMSDAKKYDAVREIQKQIVDLTREGLATYDDIDYQTARDGEYANIGNRYFKLDDEGEWQKLSDEQATKYKVTSAAGDSTYASDGTNHYRWYEPGEDASEGAEAGWRKVTEKELERQNEVTSGLGISPEDYWSNREEHSYAYDNPESYAVAKAVGGYEAYKQYSSDLYDIKADKDEYGKSISGSRKEKVQDYINSLDADYYTKLILFKSEYTSYDDENYEIIEYLNGREDISFEEEVNILRKLGFSVDAEGNVSWD